MKELERKFVIPKLPHLLFRSGKLIDQYYIPILSSNSVSIPAASDFIRIRSEKYFESDREKTFFEMTFKEGKGISRNEVETPISEEMFDVLKSRSYSRIEKIRRSYKYPFSHLFNLEVDELFFPSVQKYLLVEIEVKKSVLKKHTEEFLIDALNAIQLPDIFQMKDLKFIEVTDDEKFSNKMISIYGWPSDTSILLDRGAVFTNKSHDYFISREGNP